VASDLERIGAVAALETAALANLILGMIERTAPDPDAEPKDAEEPKK
jgi:hypothetical protein